MIVVADTSPLNYLIQIGQDHLLPQLYRRVIAPIGVIQELQHPDAPASVATWLANTPSWLEVRTPSVVQNTELLKLGKGEREAIQLAQDLQADLLLIDERKGRLAAERNHIETTGTLGVLLAAAEFSLVDPTDAYGRLLTETTFRISQALELQFLSLIAKR